MAAIAIKQLEPVLYRSSNCDDTLLPTVPGSYLAHQGRRDMTVQKIQLFGPNLDRISYRILISLLGTKESIRPISTNENANFWGKKIRKAANLDLWEV